MSYIIFPQSNNKIRVLFPCDSILSIEEIASKDLPSGLAYTIVNTLNVHSDFFDAYEYDQDIGAKFNDSLGKEIQKNRWRKARKPLFEVLDIVFNKALENGDFEKTSKIGVQRQTLRDITTTPLTGTTPEEILSEWPEILGNNPYII